MPRKRQQRKRTPYPGVFRLDNDRYLVVTTWTDPKTGRRRKRERTMNTLAEALQAHAEPPREEARERPSRPRCGDFAKPFLSEHSEGLAPSTVDRYVRDLAHWSLRFGDYFVDALEPRDIQSWVREMKAAGVAPSTINGRLNTVRLVLDRAMDEGWLAINPARRTKAVTVPRTTGRRSVSLTPSQLRSFLDGVERLAARSVLNPDIARMIQVLAWTGMRMGELRALRWEDVSDDELHIRRSVWNGHEKSTKTGDPRSLPVTGPLASLLVEQRAWLAETRHEGLPSGLVFPASGQSARAGATKRDSDELLWFKSGSCLNRALRRVCHEAGVPELSPHALRRSFEKLLRRANVDQLVRRSMAGWRSPEAQDIYTDVDEEDRRAAFGAMLQVVNGGKSS